MPAKNSIKQYLKNGYYHIYNRGVDKRIIFEDKQDYGVFLNYLKYYLSPIPKLTSLRKISVNNKTYQISDYKCKNYSQVITLLAYCLMTNHFHLLIKQSDSRSIESFMKSLGTRYTMYFNKRRQRSGRLFQGVYQAVSIDNTAQLLHLSRYIHLNPRPKSLLKQPSSYPDYLRLKNTSWVKPGEILKSFNNKNSYQNFVETSIETPEKFLDNLTLDHPFNKG